MGVKQVEVETARLVAGPAFAFGTGALCGKMTGASPVVMGVASVVEQVAFKIFFRIINYYAEKFNWSLSTCMISKNLGSALIGTASVVFLFALGVLDPIGAGVMSGLVGSGFLFMVGTAVYLKETGENCSYNEAKQMNYTERTIAQLLAMV